LLAGPDCEKVNAVARQTAFDIRFRRQLSVLERRLEMKAGLRSILVKAAVCALVVTTTMAAKAQTGAGWNLGCFGPCKGQIIGLAIGITAVGVGAGIGIHYAIRHNHTVSGCAISGPSGLELQNKGDGQTYALVGLVDGIKPAERIRVSGKKQEKVDGAVRQFLVEKPAKIYGACTAP
jgi:hypothetical protein